MPSSLESATTFTPATQSELSRFVAANASGERRALFPVGGRTALHFGYPSSTPGIEVATSELNRVIDFPARDMTITVEAGIRVEELEATLALEHQRLPVDVPQAHRATLGGAVATNTSGPRRFGCGTFRDYVIGVSAVDAQGRLFKAGGRVVKNVAGYDLCKLLTGSLGTLGIITQLTLKLRPRPETSALLWMTFDQFSEVENVLERLLVSEARPVALDVLNREGAHQIAAESRCDLPLHSAVLCIGVEGTSTEVEWQIDTLRRETVPYNPRGQVIVPTEESPRLWQVLTEFQTFSDDPVTFRANLLPSRTMDFIDSATQLGIAVQAHAGSGIVVGHLPDEAATLERAEPVIHELRSLARAARGNLILLNCDEAWKRPLLAFGDPEPGWELMRRIKAGLDPDNLLNPGRMFAAE